MTKRYAKLVAFVLGMAVFAVGLFACGNPKEQANANFCGTWELNGMQLKSMSYSEQDLATLKDSGLTCYLTITDDDNATLELFGAVTAATWSAKDANTAELHLDGSTSAVQNTSMATTQTMKYANDTISMESDGTSLTFKKIKPEDKVPAANLESQPAVNESSSSDGKKDEAPQASASSSSEQTSEEQKSDQPSEEQSNAAEEATNES